MKKYIICVLAVAALAVLPGCDRSYDDPDPIETVELTPTHSIAELKELYKGRPLEVLSDIVIGGRVNSTDQYGNIYRTMYIQDESGGIEVKVGKTNLYNIYKPSQMVYVRMRNLILGAYGGMVGIGAENVDPSSTYETSYIDVQTVIDQKIIPGPRAERYEDYVQPIEITSLDQLTAEHECMLVKLIGVEYAGLYRCSFSNGDGTYTDVDTVTTWALPAKNDNPGIAIPASYATHYFRLGGQNIEVRTSGYARFAGERVENRAPYGTKVDMTGIFTTFNGTKQLTLNDVKDVVRQ